MMQKNKHKSRWPYIHEVVHEIQDLVHILGLAIPSKTQCPHLQHIDHLSRVPGLDSLREFMQV